MNINDLIFVNIQRQLRQAVSEFEVVVYRFKGVVYFYGGLHPVVLFFMDFYQF